MGTFSYNESQIAASGTNFISFVRFRLDDTDSNVFELSDELITALYGNTNSTDAQTTRNYRTALQAAKYLQTKYTKQASFSSAGTSVQLRERAEAWAQLVTELSYELLGMSGLPPIIYGARSPSYYEDGQLPIYLTQGRIDQ